MLRKVARTFYLVVGFLFLFLAVIGVFLPLLPTTPFVLLAAFCFSKGSDRIHKWLLNHRLFGDLIQNWERYGVVRPRVKWISCISIVVMLSYPIGFLSIPIMAKVTAGIIGVCVIFFIQTRPGSKEKALERRGVTCEAVKSD